MQATKNDNFDTERISERFHQLCNLYYDRVISSIERYYENNKTKYFDKAVYKCIRDLQIIHQTTINFCKEMGIDSKEIIKLDILKKSCPNIFFFFHDDIAERIASKRSLSKHVTNELATLKKII